MNIDQTKGLKIPVAFEAKITEAKIVREEGEPATAVIMVELDLERGGLPMVAELRIPEDVFVADVDGETLTQLAGECIERDLAELANRIRLIERYGTDEVRSQLSAAVSICERKEEEELEVG